MMSPLIKGIFLATLARFCRGLSLAAIIAAVLHTSHLGSAVLVVLAIGFFAIHLWICIRIGRDV